MTRLPTIPTARAQQAGRFLAIVLAFSAWSFTPPASISLGLLVALFFTEIPGNWGRLRREPALWLPVIALLVTSLLATRAAALLPETAADQWDSVSAWCAPWWFIALAWWIRGEPRLVWTLLAAAFLGLVVGVLRRTDWSLLPEILGGLRYHFDFAATGLAFIASVCLVGLMLLRRRITVGVLGWVLWVLALGFVLIVLVVTQSRGAALVLATAGVGYMVLAWLARPAGAEDNAPRRRWAPIVSAIAMVLIAAAFLWSTQYRQQADLDALRQAELSGHLSYASSLGARINLHRVTPAIVAERPLLGWGPGTSSTEFLVPNGLVRLDPYDQKNLPDFAHLHSVALEVVTRFGLAGALLAALALLILLRAARAVWRDPRLPLDLRSFLALTGIMTLLSLTYDFRWVHNEFRFFAILYFGILYGLYLSRRDADDGASR